MSEAEKYLVLSKNPRPAWYRPFSRRRYDHRIEMINRTLNAMRDGSRRQSQADIARRMKMVGDFYQTELVIQLPKLDA